MSLSGALVRRTDLASGFSAAVTAGSQRSLSLQRPERQDLVACLRLPARAGALHADGRDPTERIPERLRSALTDMEHVHVTGDNWSRCVDPDC